jgi:hypothetical protein
VISVIPSDPPDRLPPRADGHQEFIWFNRASASFLVSSERLGLLMAAFRPPALQ